MIMITKLYLAKKVFSFVPIRSSIHTSSINMTKALVLGFYNTDDKNSVVLTENAKKFDSQVGGKLTELVSSFGPKKAGSKVFYNLNKDYPVVAVVGLGPQDATFNPDEDLDEKLENVRRAIAAGTKSVKGENDVDEIVVDDCGQPQAAAESINLTLFNFDELKSEKYKKKQVKVSPYNPSAEFDLGTSLANAQNLCRRFAHLPSNHLTPTIFGKYIEETFKPYPSVKVIVHDEAWAESKKMGSFLSVGRGSVEPSKFVEIHYNNKPDSAPYALVGKGVCFDSGGISIKPSLNMDAMRYDMGGAANVVATIFALASTNAKVNVVGLTPLCENLPSGSATKPGDVVFAMNGKSIQVDNTDAEGRLILADALCYAHEFKPQAILDIATLTGAIRIALGSTVTGVFTHNTDQFESLKKAGSLTGDRVWRMPLYADFTADVTDSCSADLQNISKTVGLAGSSTAAAFLKEFVECKQWLHLDIAGAMDNKNKCPYYNTSLTGRPVRTLYKYLTDYYETH